ncbi:cation:proton antiporter [Anaerotignum sp.]|uniref:cation:proton antiporter n=1 Tax=Anaerotignum sp. TaxID=2039241 RepID=UPI00271541D9|nr:cation:proton antiporter [Anaerotignum sp.]
MESYSFLLVLALILFSTKICGLMTERINLPQVLGALAAGVILGPSGFGIIQETDFLMTASEIGVIMLMFSAGLGTDIKELKKAGGVSLFAASLGVILPILLCGGLYYFFYEDGMNYMNMIRTIFVGVVFSATSVSITVETLIEMGKIKTKVGTTIIGAAIIDDVIGIIVLSVISGLSEGGSGHPLVVLAKIGGFFIFVAIVGMIVHYAFKMLNKHHGKSKRVVVWSLAFCFLMSYIAEKYFGVADITGAYFAGLTLCNITKTREFVTDKISVASFLFFSPVFFASIGINTNVTGLNKSDLIFVLLVFIIATATKVIGCGGAAKLCKMTTQQALGVGVGMVSRGEVALMVAQKGLSLHMVSQEVFPALILAIVATVFITPILLNIVMKNYVE